MEEMSKGCDDKASQNDLFKIESYTNGLKQFITSCKTPMTIAIQGDWGSGKTSMMQRLESLIGKSAYCATINTWQYSQFDLGDQLSISFLCSILNALETGSVLPNTAVKRMKKAAVIILKHLIKNAAFEVIDRRPYGSFFTRVFSAAGEELKKEKDKEPDVDDLIKTIDTIKRDIQEAINEKIKSENKEEKESEDKEKKNIDRVVFFIDDLDRLKPGKAVELMEVMKVLLECENCVFVLAIDYNVVVSGIKEKYGSDFDKSKAKNFFDKIIQLPFYLPVGSYDIENYIVELIKNSEGKLSYNIEEKDIPTIVDLIKTSVGCNPRSIKRVINSYILACEIFQKESQKTDKRIYMIILGTLCLHLEYEDVYDKLISEFDMKNGNGLNGLNELFDKLSGEDENFLNEIQCTFNSEKDKRKLGEFMEYLKYCIKGNKDSDDESDSNQGNEKITEEEMKLLRIALKSSSTTSSTAAELQESDEVFSLKKLSYVYDVLKSLDKEAIKSGNIEDAIGMINVAKKEVAEKNHVNVSTVSDKTTRRLGIKSTVEFAELTKDFFEGGGKLLEKIKENNRNEDTEAIESIFNSLRE